MRWDEYFRKRSIEVLQKFDFVHQHASQQQHDGGGNQGVVAVYLENHKLSSLVIIV